MTTLPAPLNFGPLLDVAARSNPCAIAGAALRLENQDNYVLIDASGQAVMLHQQVPRRLQLPHWPAGHLRLAVMDGMGGHGHGREAAEATAAGLLRMPPCATLAQLSQQLDALHADLQAQFSPPGQPHNERRPGTTLTLVELAPGQAPLLYHVGDSRLYEITPQWAAPLTVDHVPATMFALHGLLDEREWWQQVHGEHRAQISQAFILGNAFDNPLQLEDGLRALDRGCLPPFLRHLGDRRALELRRDALYLLASDGFWACRQPQLWTARWPELLAHASAAGALDALFGEFNAHPPPGLHVDNLTAIAFRLA
ncbi:protein phosphatase [Pseudoduganella violacea]|uniref:Serine/threonine protein phosphatase PrpC n=1 Tax=Pseudoduganella violacea TaxID=1715466 RepID=A0A7W5BF77_9BURK|nr:protein phosphatase [Pseudoduganella violacea]MBB3121155.1 serine/threonine protein phosphatase PrpC [Pseudoduganella violacea]